MPMVIDPHQAPEALIERMARRFSTQAVVEGLVALFCEGHGIRNTGDVLVESALKAASPGVVEALGKNSYLRGEHFSLSRLASFLGLLVDPADQLINGVYCTPGDVVRYMVGIAIHGSASVN